MPETLNPEPCRPLTDETGVAALALPSLPIIGSDSVGRSSSFAEHPKA